MDRLRLCDDRVTTSSRGLLRALNRCGFVRVREGQAVSMARAGLTARLTNHAARGSTPHPSSPQAGGAKHPTMYPHPHRKCLQNTSFPRNTCDRQSPLGGRFSGVSECHLPPISGLPSVAGGPQRAAGGCGQPRNPSVHAGLRLGINSGGARLRPRGAQRPSQELPEGVLTPSHAN
jgi:hypothetical protein